MKILIRSLVFLPLIAVIAAKPNSARADDEAQLKPRSALFFTSESYANQLKRSDQERNYDIQRLGFLTDSEHSEDVSIAKYGYDFASFNDEEAKTQVRVRGGISKASSSAHAGVQLTVNW